MSLSAREVGAGSLQSYEVRLARGIGEGGPAGERAAMCLLEHLDPPTLSAAAARLFEQRVLSAEAFDSLADAWERYRHLRYLGWD